MFVCVFYDRNSRRLNRNGFMVKPRIEPVIPGLQDIGLSYTPLRLHLKKTADLWHVRRCNIVSGYIFVLYQNIYGMKIYLWTKISIYIVKKKIRSIKNL